MRFMGGGVFVFFVISGYCIHRPQAEKGKAERDERKAQPDWLRFWVRRLLRIYPPYLAALFLSAVVLVLIAEPDVHWQNRFWVSIPMLQNYWEPGGQIASNPSLWSLPIELELYLVYPLVWWAGRQFGWRCILLCVAVISAVAQVLWLQGVNWLDASFLRFWALWCAGAGIAEWHQAGRLPVWNRYWTTALVCIAGIACAIEWRMPHTGMEVWFWGLTGGLAVIGAVQREGRPDVFGWLGMALAKVGVASYSLYLVHYPLFALAGAGWQTAFGGKPSGIHIALLACVAVLPFAWLFYVAVERPSHGLARRLGAR
jgi:peptidoglycan/LPS O-acetylase OafA/YrhL